MKRSDIAASVILIGLGGYVLVATRSYPDSLTPGAPGPGFFPALLAGLLVLFALALLLQALRSQGDGPAPTPFEWGPVVRWVIVFGAVAVFVFAAERTDFLLMLFPLLAVVMAVMGERQAKALVFAPALFVLFIYVVFARLFAVPFPTVL